MRDTSKRVLFLARELSGYFLSCIEFALSENVDLQVQIIYWPVNNEAPFEFEISKKRLRLIPVEQMNDDAFALFIAQWQPSLWIVSGWADRRYMRWTKKFKKVYKIVAFDTQWRNTLTFHLGAKWLYLKSMRFFQGAWVPGHRQVILARKFGFNPQLIKQGYYVADESLFQHLIEINVDRSILRIVFVNRIVSEKGFPEVISALAEHITQNRLNWRITVVGTGPKLADCPRLDGIDYLGFIQPRDLAAILNQHHVYVLSSLYEPWGVSVHEAAMCALPLILSNAVGASDAFLEHGENGFVFPHGDFISLIQSIEHINQLSDEQYRLFSARSLTLASQVNQRIWAGQLVDWLKLSESCAV